MRRTAILLTIPAFLSILIFGGHGGGPVGGYLLEIFTTRQPGAAMIWIPIVPLLLLAGTCVGPERTTHRVLHAIGSAGLLAIWAWLLSVSEGRSLTLMSSMWFLGLTLYSLLEAIVLRKFNLPVEPSLRLSAFLLGMFGVTSLVRLTTLLSRVREYGIDNALDSGFLIPILMILCAWGMLKRVLWVIWPGLGVSLCLLVNSTWGIVSELSRIQAGEHGGSAMLSLTIFMRAPEILVLAVIVPVLGLCLWTRWKVAQAARVRPPEAQAPH